MAEDEKKGAKEKKCKRRKWYFGMLYFFNREQSINITIHHAVKVLYLLCQKCT